MPPHKPTEKKCEADERMYMSNPPQYKCKDCGQFWFVKDLSPTCKSVEINTVFPQPIRLGIENRHDLCKEEGELPKIMSVMPYQV